jgi:hypothetical protein
MASDAVEITAMDKRAEETGTSKQGGLHQDVEVGHEMVDVDRIERVYA